MIDVNWQRLKDDVIVAKRFLLEGRARVCEPVEIDMSVTDDAPTQIFLSFGKILHTYVKRNA